LPFLFDVDFEADGGESKLLRLGARVFVCERRRGNFGKARLFVVNPS